MDKEKLKEAIKLLHSFANEESLYDDANGMCVNLFLRSNLGGILEELRTIYQQEVVTKWPKYTGNIRYPVPHPILSPDRAYNMVISLWEVTDTTKIADIEYVANRKEFCIFFADYLEEHYLQEESYD